MWFLMAQTPIKAVVGLLAVIVMILNVSQAEETDTTTSDIGQGCSRVLQHSEPLQENPIESDLYKDVGHDYHVTRVARSLKADDQQTSESFCSSKLNDNQHGRCIRVTDCVEAFESPVADCNSEGASSKRQSVCCFDGSINITSQSIDSFRLNSNEKASASRGLVSESVLEKPTSVLIPKFHLNHLQSVSSESSKITGYSLEQHNQFLKSMRSISEYMETHKKTITSTTDGISVESSSSSSSNSKQQLLDVSVNVASRHLTKSFGYTDTNLVEGIRYLDAMHYYLSSRSNVSLGPMILNKPLELRDCGMDFVCMLEPECNSESFYRSFSGACNNLEYPLLGRASTAYDRLMQPHYDDGFQAMRQRDSKGNLLPGVREIALVSFGTLDGQSKVMNQMGSFFTQFIAHDMSSAALEQLSFDPTSPVDCCKDANYQSNVACAPIKVPKFDPYYGLFKKCLNFVRTVQAPPAASSCLLGPRQQMSKVSHWLDLSVVYGDNVEDLDSLRNPHNKALLIGSVKKLDLDDPDGPYMANDNQGFLQVGDKRANQTPMLSILHTVFWRLHNKLALTLAQLNPHWSSDRLFQEARRLNIAIYQTIVYKEFLPVLVGKQVLQQFNIDLSSGSSSGASPHTSVYDASLKYGASLNEFAHGAYRLHNLVWGLFQTHNDLGKLTRVPTPLWLVFQKGQMICQRHMFKGTLNSMLMDGSGNWDANMPDDLHGRLFQTKLQLVGHDLLSLDIQRGRDHGIPPYVKVREACGLGSIQSWSGLDSVLQFGASLKLRLVYKSPQDIDMVVGGQLELPMKGALVGPTVACLIGEQFRRSRFGDRYFFDNLQQPYPFTVEQVATLKEQVSMSSVLCHTTSLGQAQANAFSVSDVRKDCKQYSFIQMDLWKEKRGQQRVTADLEHQPHGIKSINQGNNHLSPGVADGAHKHRLRHIRRDSLDDDDDDDDNGRQGDQLGAAGASEGEQQDVARGALQEF